MSAQLVPKGSEGGLHVLTQFLIYIKLWNWAPLKFHFRLLAAFVSWNPPLFHCVQGISEQDPVMTALLFKLYVSLAGLVQFTSEVCCLESHLHERIGAEPMTRDVIFSITFELERLAIILTYKVAKSRLSIPNAAYN
jgi:hypothetical protein